jgi:large subunit ribosomal protein L25
MSDLFSFSATPRDRAGKGRARTLRREHRVPAIIYGGGAEPMSISLPLTELLRESGRPGFFTRLYDVSLPDGALRVLPRDIQRDPVSDTPIHVDFMRYVKGARIAVQVAVHFLDQEKSEGLKLGGVLNVVRHKVELLCPFDAIPDSISVSLAGLKIGDSIHISRFVLPNGVTPTIRDRDFTVATIVAPTTVVEEAPAAAATAEGVAEPGAEGAAAAAPGAAPAAEVGKGAKAEAGKGGKAEGEKDKDKK